MTLISVSPPSLSCPEMRRQTMCAAILKTAPCDITKGTDSTLGDNAPACLFIRLLPCFILLLPESQQSISVSTKLKCSIFAGSCKQRAKCAIYKVAIYAYSLNISCSKLLCLCPRIKIEIYAIVPSNKSQ